MTRAVLQVKTRNCLKQHIDIDNPVQLSRLSQFDRWITSKSLNIFSVNLADYRDYLLCGRQLSVSSVSSHLSTLRGAYQRLLASDDLYDYLYTLTDRKVTVGERKARVDHMVRQLVKNSNSKNSKVPSTFK